MRLRHRSTVVFPQPDGPMNAVISLAATSRSTSRTARCAAVVHLEVAELEDDLPFALGLLLGAGVSGTSTSVAGASTSVVTSMTLAVAVDERGHGSVLGGHAACRREKKAVTSRARMVNDEHDHDQGERRAPGPVLRPG